MERKPFAIIIPVYNHAESIASVVSEALTFAVPVFVVDDGSTDSTYERITKIPGITVLRHNENKGKGEAIITGFKAAAAVAEWAVTIDADGQHHPQDCVNLLAAIPKGKRPIVVGKREGMASTEVPWSSRFGREFSNFWVRASGGPAITDTQSGMRLYPLPEALELPVTARRFQFEVEILARASWKGIPVLEAPVRVTYQAGEKRISHYRGFVDFMRNAATFTRLIFMRIVIPASRRARWNRMP
jgi:glycosyltransferase involved in cell wall biosynthesis